MSCIPNLRGIFKRVKRKRSGGKNQRDALGEDTPRPEAPLPETSVRSASPGPVQSTRGAASAPVFNSLLQTQAPPPELKIEALKPSRDAWPNLAAFLDILNHIPAFASLAAAIGDLSWFVRAHENVITAEGEYTALLTQLEALFGDLHGHFSESTPPAMTTSMFNLSEAIQTELTRVYHTRDKSAISRYIQASYDLENITECYRRIQGQLNRILLNSSLNVWRTLDKHAAETQLDKLNMSMSARYDSADAHVVQRRECTPNTRERVLIDLKAWKDNQDGEKVCWINGMAGTGKTTIANTLCSTLDQRHELGASFFCTRSLPECRNVKFILPTVAYQLARFSNPFRGVLLQALERDPDVHTKVLHVQFRRMILEPLQAAAPSLPTSVLVVIDALDECDDGDGVEQILEILLANAPALPIKFLVSSRPEHHIRDKISKSTRKTQLILHELNEKMVKADIETYLQAELEAISIFITEDQLAALAERAGALFIFAATVVRYLKRGNATVRLATVLKIQGPGQGSTNLMKEIDQLYEAVLISAFDNDHLEPIEKEAMELVLHTVVCAQEPLTAAALAGLLGLTLIQVADALKPLWSVLHLSESDSSHRVSTLHASFPDYMLDPQRAKRFACNAKIHNGKLAELSFFRIERNIPQFNVCGLESSYVPDKDIPNLDERVKQNIPLDLLYACQYWAAHLSQGGKQNERATALHEFLSKRLLLWMEVLNLSNRIHRAVGQIEMTIAWLEIADLGENTILLARNALHFVTMFATSPVSQSTPHLYVSMLSSWPHYQPISKYYARKTLGLVKVKGIETTERQIALLSSIPVGCLIWRVAFSPTGAFFAAGTSDNKVLIWDAVSCRMTIDPIGGHTDGVTAISISPHGDQICSGSGDCTLRILDPQNGRLIAGPLEGHTSWVFSVRYSPNGQYLASGSYDGTVRIWDTHDWHAKCDPLDGNDGRVFSVAFSPDSSMVVAGSESLIHLWDLASGRQRGDPLEGHSGYIWTLAFTPDGKYLVSGSDDHTIRIWDIATGRVAFGPLQDHLSAVDSVAISPNGQLLASAALDNTIRIWDIQNWKTRSLFRHTGMAKSVTFSPDGLRIVSGSVDGNIRVWEVLDASDEKGVEGRSEGHNGWIRSAAFSPCGAYIVSGSYDMTTRIWDAHNGKSICNPLEGDNDWVTRVGISSDSDHIFSVSIDRLVHIWDSKTGQLKYAIGPIETDGDYDAMYQIDWPAAFLFDRGWVVCGSQSGRIYIWENDKLVGALTGHSHAVYSVACSPDEGSFVSGDGGGDLILWDAITGEKLLGPFDAHSDYISSIAFSLDGLLVASGSGDCTICLWNTHTRSPVGDSLRGHTSGVCSVAFSPQGTQLVSGSEDKTIRVWDVTSGQSIAVFQGHISVVLSVAFSLDGARILSGSADMTLRIWNAPTPAEHLIGASYNEHTFEPANIPENIRALSWTMDEGGWVQDNEGHLLLWVPPDLRSVLILPRNTVLISGDGRIELDFSDAKLGDTWETCYEP